MLWGGRRTCRSVCDNMWIFSELHAMWRGSIQTLHLGPSIHKLLVFFMFSWQDYSISPTHKHHHVCVCRYICSPFILWLHQIACSVKLCQLVNLLTVNHTFVNDFHSACGRKRSNPWETMVLRKALVCFPAERTTVFRSVPVFKWARNSLCLH